MVGTDLLHYRIDAHLGTGGMGEVYRARDTKLGRAVALKFLPEFVTADPDRVARFDREARLLASLNHPSIAGLHAMERAEGRPFLVMELVEGDTLADRLRRGPLPAGEALTLAKQICEALEAAHEKGVIHRDLKPANIKITPAGQIKVLDFGLAKALAPEGTSATAGATHSPTLSLAATRAGVILGTAAYMAPEQAKGVDADQRADIFALGCVLYEMLSGRQPFQGDSVPEILASVLKSDPDTTLLPSNLHPRLVELIRRCLAKDPRQRWHAAADVRMEIETLLADPHGATMARAVTDRREPLWQRAVPFVATALVAGAAAGAVAWYARPSPPTAVTRFPIVLPADQELTRTGRHNLAISPDGQNLVYVANAQLYLRRMDAFGASPIPGTNVDPTTPFFSPDGLWIGFWSAGKLQKVSVAGGTAVPIADVQNPWGVSWQTDDFILVGQGPAGIVRVPANGGDTETVINVTEGERAMGPQLLPDGDHVLFTLAKAPSGFDPGTAPPGTAAIGTWDAAQMVSQSLNSGERTVLVEGGSDARYVPSGHLVFAVGDSLYAVAFDAGSLEVKGGRVPILDDVSRSTLIGAAHLASSDSGLMAYVTGGLENVKRRLAFVDRQGVVTNLSLPEDETYANPRVSPDGSQLVIERGNADGTEVNLWIYDLVGAVSPRQLTYGSGTLSTAPEWTRDGKRILFLHRTRDTETILTQSADGSGPAEPFTAVQVPDMNSSVISQSPDGTNLLVRVGPTGQRSDIWLLPLAGTEKPQALTEGPGNKLRPRFSPDGNWMAYSSDESGRSEVYVQNFRTGGAKRRITTGGGFSTPDWSPDGRELFYLNGISPSLFRLMSVEVRTQSGFEVLPPRTIVEGVFSPGSQQPYSITRDGKILVLRSAGEGQAPAASPDIRVTQNWFEELKRLVPSR